MKIISWIRYCALKIKILSKSLVKFPKFTNWEISISQ